ITANAFDPGLMPETALMREAPALLRFILRHIPITLLRRLFSPHVHTTQESGDALARLVTDPELATTTGRYFEGRRQIRSSDESFNDERAVELWNAGVALSAARQEERRYGQLADPGGFTRVPRPTPSVISLRFVEAPGVET